MACSPDRTGDNLHSFKVKIFERAGLSWYHRRFPEITGEDNLTVFSYSGRVKFPEWRWQWRRADLWQFEIFRHGPIIIYARLPAGGTYYPICMFPTNSECLISISDAFSAFCLRVFVIFPMCSLYPQQKRAYSVLHPRAWTYIYRSTPVGTYWMQSPGFLKIVYYPRLVQLSQINVLLSNHSIIHNNAVFINLFLWIPSLCSRSHQWRGHRASSLFFFRALSLSLSLPKHWSFMRVGIKFSPITDCYFQDLVDVAPCSPFVLWTTLSPPFTSNSESKGAGSAILRCFVCVNAKSSLFFPSAFRSESGLGEAWVTECFWLAAGSGVWLAGCAPSPGWECFVRTASKCCRQPWTVSVLNFPAD